jgi:branched-chain amino acid aminotransferase
MRALVEPAARALPDETLSNGCFETMRAYRGRIFRLEGHLDRLYASAKFLGTRIEPDRARVRGQLTDALRRSKLKEAVVRIALMPSPPTKSALTLSGTFGGGASPSIMVQPPIVPPASAYRLGLHVVVVPTRKFSVASISPQAKYSARLGSVMAIMEGQLRGADEALFMEAMVSVTESTASNFGIIASGTIITPPCWLGLLAGITREILFELAGTLRLPIRELPLTRHELYNAGEAFMTSTLKEVIGVTRIDGRLIGTGRPGPITRRLRQAFIQLVKREHGPV